MTTMRAEELIGDHIRQLKVNTDAYLVLVFVYPICHFPHSATQACPSLCPPYPNSSDTSRQHQFMLPTFHISVSASCTR